ncbi:DUF3048 domain-containing protein [Phytoactinopolyspora mesophila]|uniref:DUF3048 domain-containing protein n=1 Tax=Phytoactinopolyspora mesophila TaxID=2650750 RepID=A0A7K3M8S0_9ACTN|nr:DUF3048 domain-containing protein [Phytoactinopolyspora mesophila]NDL59673.1 DUF3048 domain-containing protein [Phytoactinopolyspora mesophila]
MKRSQRTLAATTAATAALAAFALLIGLALRTDDPNSPGDPQVAVPGSVAPLTGLPVDNPAVLERPAVAIKVSDVRQAHPQVGVAHADIVFAQPIGEAYTRLAVVFHSDLPESVGPVRSVRPADAALLGPLSPVFANTMGAGWVVEYTDSVADWDNLGTSRMSGTGAYVLDPARPRPDHVFARPAILLDASDRAEPPAPYFAYAGGAEPTSAEQAAGPGTSIEVQYGSAWVVGWTYDAASGRYSRTQPWGPHVMAGGTQISATNVVVIQVESVVDKLVDGHGAAVPVLQLVGGSGPFTAFTGGFSVTGTWTKDGANDPFEFRTDSATELALSPGNTWVELPALSVTVTAR